MSAPAGEPVPAGHTRWRAILLALVFGGVAAALLLLVSTVREERATRDAFPSVDGRMRVAGLDAPIEILRDGRGIPHVEAASEAGALFGLGFAHAQDRLAQMIWLRRSARGRAAAWVGAEALPADRRARLLGIGRHADAAAEALPAATRTALEAYAAGVNARLARIRAGLAAPPLALDGLDLAPDPALDPEDGGLADWTPADSLALVKLHAWGLAGSLDASLVVADLIERLGGVGARPFRPEGARMGDVEPSTEARRPLRLPAASLAVVEPLRAAIGLAGRGVGSSAFVVAARHCVWDRPMLGADAHLEPLAPALYYEAHVRAPEFEAAGATIPGVPVFWIGRNGRVAWAATGAGAVVADLYVETLDPDGGDRYHDGRRWRDLEVREERIEVRGESPETLVVRETRHGPLLGPILSEEREPLALAWTGALPADGVGAFLEVARAPDAAALRRALSRHHEPVVAVAYADAKGEGGVQMAGFVPRRTLPTGLVPVPGRSRWYDWDGAIPFAELPHISLSERQPWVIAADGRLRTRSSVEIEWLWRPGVRAARIDARLREAVGQGKLELRTLAELQHDVYSARALAVRDDALALAGEPDALDADARLVVDRLRAWDGEMGAERVGAALYHVFLNQLGRELFEARLGSDLYERYLSLSHTDPEGVIAALLADARRGLGEPERGEPEGWEDPAAVGEAVRRSLRTTQIWLAVRAGPSPDRWAWGGLHTLTFRPMPPGAIPGPRLGPLPFAGDGSTLSVGAYDPALPFDVSVVSAYRFVSDPGDEPALTALAPGQSEHADHPHRSDGLERWRAGGSRLLVTRSLFVEEAAVSRLVLEPAP